MSACAALMGHRSWCLRVSREPSTKKACERRAASASLLVILAGVAEIRRRPRGPSIPEGYADTEAPEGPLRVKGAAPGSEQPPAAPKVNRTGRHRAAYLCGAGQALGRIGLNGRRSLSVRDFGAVDRYGGDGSFAARMPRQLGCPPRVERPGARRPPGAGGRSCLLPGLLDRARERLGIGDVDEIPDLDGA